MVHQFDERMTYVRCLQQQQQQNTQHRHPQLLTYTATPTAGSDYVMYAAGTGNTIGSRDNIAGTSVQSPTSSVCPRGGGRGSYVTRGAIPQHQSSSLQQRQRQITYYTADYRHQLQVGVPRKLTRHSRQVFYSNRPLLIFTQKGKNQEFISKNIYPVFQLVCAKS